MHRITKRRRGGRKGGGKKKKKKSKIKKLYQNIRGFFFFKARWEKNVRLASDWLRRSLNSAVIVTSQCWYKDLIPFQRDYLFSRLLLPQSQYHQLVLIQGQSLSIEYLLGVPVIYL